MIRDKHPTPPTRIPRGTQHVAVNETDHPIDFAFVLVPSFSMIAFVTAVEVLRVANQLAGRGLYRWCVLSDTGQPVVASNGLSINSDGALHQERVKDRVYVCSGVEPSRNTSRTVWTWLARQWSHGAEIGSLCAGAYALAKAGVLKGVSFTMHWEDMDGFKEIFPHFMPQDCAYVIDGRVSSSGGGTTSADLFLAIVEAHYGGELASMARQMMNIADKRPDDSGQRSSLAVTLQSRNPKLIAAVSFIAAHLEDDLDLDDIAKRASLSRRQMERLFVRCLKEPPRSYIKGLRLARARKLLIETNYAMIDIAIASGFNSASNFSKLFRAKYGQSPHKFRIDSL